MEAERLQEQHQSSGGREGGSSECPAGFDATASYSRLGHVPKSQQYQSQQLETSQPDALSKVHEVQWHIVSRIQAAQELCLKPQCHHVA